MRLLFYMLLFSSIINAQENFTFKTDYKLKPNGEYAVENFSFSFQQDKGKLIRKDLDLGYEKTYWIKFYDSSYSTDGNYFLVAYVTDFEKHFENEIDKKDVNNFTIIYNKKLGEILYFKIQSLSSEMESFYLTKLGKEIINSKNN